MALILIDNYDSFTYNLLHYCAELGEAIEVIRNDALSAEQVIKKAPKAIIISPGPGTPDEAGICLELIKKAAGSIPILGICLGHQAIAQAFGGKIIRAPSPMHGKISLITHRGETLFKGLPSPFPATRYHSLVVEQQTLPDCFAITAETDDGCIMGISHKTQNLHGLQFHPESIASAHGHTLLKHFLEGI